MTQTSLVFLRRDGEILLAMKKRGFGEGRWNGPGGKLIPGETFEAAAAREVLEEIGVQLAGIKQVAELQFYMDEYDGDVMKNIHCKVFVCREWSGEPAESEEMAPQWFGLDAIPYEQMWADDVYWLPEILAGRYVEAKFWFGTGDTVRDMKVTVRNAQ